ncbi:hypothetical protein [Kocuria rosea]|uniref:HNH endonuclease n=1 Tax=Kocuria rosea TaxID=1275 RepID=UPI003D340B19
MEWEDGGYQLKNELFGLIAICCSVVAALKGDYVIGRGVFIREAGPDWPRLEEAAVRAGYVTRVQLEDGSPALKLVEDTSLFHMIPRAERDRNNQHRNDTRRAELTIPVRVRDGDQCRYCGIVVHWGDRRGGRGGTYDHLDPSRPAESPEDLVACCRTCNSARQDDLASFDKELKPAPTDPFYSASTAKLLAKHGITVQATDNRTPVKEATSGQTNGATTAAHSKATPAPAVEPSEQRPAEAPEPGPSKDAPKTTDRGSGRSRQNEGVTDQAAPGRDGSGSGRAREGSGRVGSLAPPPPEKSRPENPPTDQPRPGDHKPGKRKRPRRRKKK